MTEGKRELRFERWTSYFPLSIILITLFHPFNKSDRTSTTTTTTTIKMIPFITLFWELVPHFHLQISSIGSSWRGAGVLSSFFFVLQKDKNKIVKKTQCEIFRTVNYTSFLSLSRLPLISKNLKSN